MNILVTGCAGFIGFHVSLHLLKKNQKVLGIDNINNYYDTRLKIDRLKILKKYKNFVYKKVDISSNVSIKKIFNTYKLKYVVHLAAQAGVRYSLSNPDTYFQSNISGHYNLMFYSNKFKVKHFLFASSSSVYGNSRNFPLNENERTDTPQSFYAASKKINEIMTYSFSASYKLPSTSLRFFTVYGPYGRPDMFLFKLVKAITEKKKINIHNFGNHERDFTYVGDVAESIVKLIKFSPTKDTPYNTFNIGSNNPTKLKKFINIVEEKFKKKAMKKNIKLQKGDVIKTHSSNIKLVKKINKTKFVDIETGITRFIEWYINYYKIKL